MSSLDSSKKSPLVDAGRSRQAQHGSSIASHDGDWKLRFSDSKQYVLSDLFYEDVFSAIQQRISRTSLTKIVEASISVASATAFLISVVLVFTSHKVVPFENSSQFLLHTLSLWFGLSKSVTGNSFLTSALLSLFVMLLAQISLSAELWRDSKDYVRLIEDLRIETRNAKQIYPGSGTLQFSFGHEGIMAHSNTIDLTIGWHAVSPVLLPLEKLEVGRGRRRSIRYADKSDAVDSATHLVVFLEPADTSANSRNQRDDKIDAHEYLVIPKRFFASPQNATDWSDFVRDLKLAKEANHQKKRTIFVNPDHQASSISQSERQSLT